jgi:hypothetical protein
LEAKFIYSSVYTGAQKHTLSITKAKQFAPNPRQILLLRAFHRIDDLALDDVEWQMEALLIFVFKNLNISILKSSYLHAHFPFLKWTVNVLRFNFIIMVMLAVTESYTSRLINTIIFHYFKCTKYQKSINHEAKVVQEKH